MLGQHGNCSSAHLPVELSENITCYRTYSTTCRPRLYKMAQKHDPKFMITFFKACVDLHCEDPCFRPTQVCGSGADCNVKNHTPVCSCPKGFTGDPFQSCRRFTREDLCNPNPCGLDARCQPGSDRSGNDKPASSTVQV